ncbi:hypothetical protein V6N13_043395 [Hibiscus sabdariffa]
MWHDVRARSVFPSQLDDRSAKKGKNQKFIGEHGTNLAMEADGEEMDEINVSTGAPVRKESEGNGSAIPIANDKASYVHVVIGNKGSSGEPIRVPGFIDKDMVIM